MAIVLTQGQFSTGRDLTLVLIDPLAGQIDLQNVTSFQVQQVTQAAKVDRIDGIQLNAELPKGWTGTITMDRANSSVDDAFAVMEQTWISGATYQVGTMFQYVNEGNGSVSVYAYDNVCLKLADAGEYASDKAVRMRIHFAANQRRRV